ncbi:hypothetical protein BX666DRAFT_1893624 [Dichotomocladium elegans]|nr:hypothetical protein BX666DRAFT_1893624 [Dichotomocladium elegans]
MKGEPDRISEKPVYSLTGLAGTHCIMTLTAEALYPMVELAHFTVPTSLETLHSFLMELTTLKRVHQVYQQHCVKREDASCAASRKMIRSSLTWRQLDDILNFGTIQHMQAAIEC